VIIMPQTAAGQASRLNAILESAVDAIITIDDAGKIETVNPAAKRLFGYDRAGFIGRNVHFLMPEPYHSEYDSYLQNYRAKRRRKVIGIGCKVIGLRGDGTTFPMHLSVSEFHVGGDVHFAGIIRDLTDQANTEQALLQAQKMEALGQLTGGIAHDFNNLLTVIVGNLEMLDGRLDNPSHHALLAEALEAAEVGSRLTGRLLAFARRDVLEPKLVNLNELVVALSDMLRRTLGETISLSTALGEEIWTTRVDPSQAESAIVNLAVNARDAMPAGGRLLVETANVVIEPDEAIVRAGFVAGEYVQVAVSDTGTGMPQAIADRAFEPFFTTKDRGRGTGLGLSMVYGFAKQSGGHAAIYSEAGVGTTVKLYLPRHDVDAAAEGAPATDVGVAHADGEWVMVVEDDVRIRRLTVARLTELGYRITEAASGDEALQLLAGLADVALVFTDLVMPDMSGQELAATVRARYPSVKVLLTSGYSEEFANSEDLSGQRLRLLRKPYRMAELADAVRAALTETSF
jgi:PAS domain S-box-containing protein